MSHAADQPKPWRKFAERRETVSWMRLRRQLSNMPGAAMVDLACDRMSEAALIFKYRNHRFGVDLHEGMFRFTVEDPSCPDEILCEVLSYVQGMVSPSDAAREPN